MTDEGVPNPGFGLYIHWPFCLSKCPYCDFNSHAAVIIDQARWQSALLAELAHYAPEATEPLTSIYFGGGTPSLMAPDTVAALIDRTRVLFQTAPDLEITLEANPSSVDVEIFPAFKAAGVNRVSLGVQSFDDEALRFLGRRHDAGEARTAIARAADTFDRFSFDLIYARPGQTVTDWSTELRDALGFGARHLSLYQLTIESGTPFFRDGIQAADGDQGADLYEATQDVMAGAGLPAYEISNHAVHGEESRHNLTYWLGGAYIGIGPGAHGRLYGDQAIATHQVHDPARWLELVKAEGHGTAKRRVLSREDRMTERIMMGLRLASGLSRPLFMRQMGIDVCEALNPATLNAAKNAGYLEISESVVVATPTGRQLLNGLVERLLMS